VCRNVSGVPQRPQKLRVAGGDELYSTGWPAEKTKSSELTVIQGTIAAADALRQVRH
jgi:dihydrofolate reductase